MSGKGRVRPTASGACRPTSAACLWASSAIYAAGPLAERTFVGASDYGRHQATNLYRRRELTPWRLACDDLTAAARVEKERDTKIIDSQLVRCSTNPQVRKTPN
jgi:hypothetical protein